MITNGFYAGYLDRGLQQENERNVRKAKWNFPCRVTHLLLIGDPSGCQVKNRR